MKFKPLFCALLMTLTPLLVKAGPLIVIGTPGDSLLATPTGPIPYLDSLLLTFANLTPGTFNPATYASQGVTIASPDGLIVEPFSTQSNPNFLFDDSADGTADITIGLDFGTEAIGVGIADSDNPVDIALQPLGLGGVDLGTPFGVTISETTVNPGNGYFVVQDASSDIYGLQITETNSGPDYSGLAIADVQVVPEPSSFIMLLTGGAIVIGSYKLRKRT